MQLKWIRHTNKGNFTEQNMREALKIIEDGNSIFSKHRSVLLSFKVYTHILSFKIYKNPTLKMGKKVFRRRRNGVGEYWKYLLCTLFVFIFLYTSSKLFSIKKLKSICINSDPFYRKGCLAHRNFSNLSHIYKIL